MAYSECYIQNKTDQVFPLYEKDFNPGEIFKIDDEQRFGWSNNSDVIKAISDGYFKIIGFNGEIDNISDQITYLKSISNPFLMEKRDISSKIWIHESSRPFGSKINFTGAGDDPTNPIDIGNGPRFNISHGIGDSTSHILIAYFNCVENVSFIHEGYIMWNNCQFDYISAFFIPRVCNYIPIDETSVTQYFLYGDMILPPATLGQSKGNIIVTSDLSLGDGGLVYIPYREDGTRDLCFWDATWNITTKRFENIIQKPTGDGNYNLFGKEKLLYRMANKISLVGSGFEKLQTADTDQIGHGMGLKFEGITEGVDHEWKAGITLTMFRNKTC